MRSFKLSFGSFDLVQAIELNRVVCDLESSRIQARK